MFKVLQEKYGFLSIYSNCWLARRPNLFPMEYRYSPLEVTAITIGGGCLSIFAYVTAGKLSDRLGRRPILSVIYVIYFVTLITFYNSNGGAFTVVRAQITKLSSSNRQLTSIPRYCRYPGFYLLLPCSVWMCSIRLLFRKYSPPHVVRLQRLSP